MHARTGDQRAAASRLGPAVTPAVDLEPPPLRRSVGRLALLVLGIGLLALAAWLATDMDLRLAAPFAAVAGLPMALAGVALLLRRARSRGRLTVHERGIVLERAGRASALAFDDISTVTFDERPLLSNGEVKGTRRRLSVTTSREHVAIDHAAPADLPDPVGPVIAEALGRAAEHVEARMAAGGRLEGQGWSLDRMGISARGGVVPLASIGNAGVFDDHVRLWRESEDEPFLDVPAASANAPLLLRVALLALERRPAMAEAPSATTLGRVLFRKSTDRSVLVLGVLVGLALAAAGPGIVLAGRPPDSPPEIGLVILGVTSCVVGLGLVAAAVWWWGVRFEVRERGVSRRTFLGEESLRYADVERMACNATPIYTHGVYTGTRLVMSLVADDGRKLSVSATARGVDDDLQGLGDHVAGVVAARMEERLRAGQSVAWGKSAWLTPDGVRFRASRFLGSGREEHLPYAAELSSAIQNGFMTLYLGPDPRPRRLFTLACSEDNFYPGLLVLESRAAAEAAAGESA